MITAPALSLMPTPSKKDDTPIDYETRCIVMDATRAAKLGDTVEKACSYARGSWQRQMWLNAYSLERHRLEELVVPNTFKEPGETDDQWIDRVTGATVGVKQ